MKKNAVENVRCSLDQLKHAETDLNQACSTVEKQENRQLIENSLTSVRETIKNVESTLKQYKD